MQNHCKVAQRQISVRIIESVQWGGGGGGGSKCGEFGRNTFWIVPSGNYNDITFMNFACLFNSGFNLLQFAQVNLYTTFGNILLVFVMQYKLRIKHVRVSACACMYVCMWTPVFLSCIFVSLHNIFITAILHTSLILDEAFGYIRYNPVWAKLHGNLACVASKPTLLKL